MRVCTEIYKSSAEIYTNRIGKAYVATRTQTKTRQKRKIPKTGYIRDDSANNRFDS